MDTIRRDFLRAQLEAAAALTRASEIVRVTPFEGDPPDRYLIDFRCRCFVHDGKEVLPIDRVLIGIRFPENYHDVFEPQHVISVHAPLAPPIWHPNVAGRFMCPGLLPPGTPLIELVMQVHEVLAGHRVTFDERYALNPVVCSWARRNRQLFPTDRRPLRRRSLERRSAAADSTRAGAPR